MAFFSAQLGQKASAIEGECLRDTCTPAASQKGGQEVAEVDQVLGNLARGDGSRPVGNQRHVGAGVSHRALGPLDHVAIELGLDSSRGAVVASEENQGVVTDAKLIELGRQLTDDFVNVGDHVSGSFGLLSLQFGSSLSGVGTKGLCGRIMG